MKHSKLEIALLTISVVFVVVMLIVPLVSVLVNSLAEGWEFYIQALTTPYVLSALRLTLLATVVSVIVNTIFGLGAAWAISKFDFRGKHFSSSVQPGPSANLGPSAPCPNCAARPLRCPWKSTPSISQGQPMPLRRPSPYHLC